MNIKPVNGHVLIEPLTHETFIKSGKETFEEIGIVVDFDEMLNPDNYPSQWSDTTGVVKPPKLIEKGWRVYFDSWLAAKYPTGDGDKYFWLVPFQDIRAVSHEKDQIPE